MGMYTELVLAVELNAEAGEIVPILEAMISPKLEERSEVEAAIESIPPHPLFQTTRWWMMLLGTSCYFRGGPHSSIDDHCGHKSLVVRFNIKNYESEIEHFINWLDPYVRRDGYAGYFRYEEDLVPTLIFYEPEGLKTYRPTEPDFLCK